MASIFPVSPLINFRRFTPCKLKAVTACKSVIKSVTGITKVPVTTEPIVRRSANYKPCLWDDHFLQSLKTEYMGEAIDARASALREEVRMIFNNVVEPLDQLELIDQLQRLGLDYHFHDEINRTLKNIHTGQKNETWEKDLHATALEFRLLRQHGHYISPEGFKRFTENGSFNKGIRADVQGLLSLYEASYFSIDGESLMDEAWSFTSNLLKECPENTVDLDLQMQVRNALELPLQWRIPRFDAKWYINLYQKSGDMIPAILAFAKLDFNVRQALNQEELKDLSRWWSRLGMGEKLPFSRDRLVASFFWSLGITGEPHHRYCREVLTKIIELIGVYDDVYDVYGTLDELELFTDVVHRWDINAMKELPDYMKLCFLSLINVVNETTYDILKDHNIDTFPHQKKWFNDLFERYIVEARWYNSGYQPTLEEYLKNGFVSIGGPIIVLYSYICTEDQIKKEDLEFIEDLPDIVRLACEILRLSDDYGTSSAELKRGDVPSSIHCYMSDTGVSEEVSREHMMNLIRKKWAQINKLRFSKENNNPLSWSFVDIMLNLIRLGHCVYNAGDDGYGVEDVVAKDTLVSLLVEPIPL
ncbi:(+)-delta-cadinene synthase [Heracleum sosnowskyi]|uniref:(+)-delta-cadinene synthase n=1 Tax=Heracleum sosnowskyi TaxID=360622 RepID=A0AAD8HLZ0_9APIA|nr:(+)-delta-cadinene synthase [Heracleum sosnowskyi]